LRISKALVERHDGEIGFDSGTGGSRFYFTLPINGPQ
jgi:signal transduction histidine kinase